MKPRSLSMIFPALACVITFVSLGHAGQPLSASLPDDVAHTLVEGAKSQKDPTVIRLRRHLDETAAILEQTDTEEAADNAKSQGTLRAERRSSLAAKLNEFASMREEVRDRFAETRQQLVVLNLAGQVQSWDKLKVQAEERFDRIAAALGALRDSSNSTAKRKALIQARALLSELHGNVIAQEAAPGNVPLPTFRRPTLRVTPPPRPASEKAPAYALARPLSPNALYAFSGNTLLAPPPIPSEAVSCNYTAADLADDGHEIQLTADIKALAQKLSYSPVQIYKYVYDTIAYEPYYGSLKGAQGTLVAGSGNATDQASLLIALLRASNIPARYVTGQIGIDDNTPLGQNGRAPRWLGVKTYEAAANVLTFGNIPSGPDTIENQTSGVYLDHVWAEACVPYGHYRGGGIDNTGERWIPLDTSVKDKTYQNGIATAVSFNYSSTAGAYMASRSDQLPHEKYADQVEAYIKGIAPNYSNNTLKDVPYSGTQAPLKFDILPASPPYSVYQYYNWSNSGVPDTAALPDAHRYKFTVTVKNGATSLLTTTLTYPDVVLKRITLSYTPADTASQNFWNTWNGALPASAVNVRPVLKAEGVTQGTSTGQLTLGANHTLIMKLDLPEFDSGSAVCVNDSGSASDPLDPDLHCVNKTVYNNITAGSYIALQAYALQTSDALLSQRAAALIASTRSNPAPTPANPGAYEATTGEFLHLTLLKYLRYVADGSQSLGGLNGVSAQTATSLGLTSSSLKVNYIFDLPFSVSPGGLYCDVKGGLLSTIKLNTTVWPADSSAAAIAAADKALKDETWPTFKLATYVGSAYEHYVWQENAKLDAVSTVRGLQFASETGIPIVTLNASNIANYNSLMDVGSTATSMAPYRTQITALVNDGATVTAPRSAIAYTSSYTQTSQSSKWNGAVYMAENQTKGYAEAAISGNLSGSFALDGTDITEWTPPPEISSSLEYAQETNSTTLAPGLNANTVMYAVNSEHHMLSHAACSCL